jgi:hypothetical protein
MWLNKLVDAINWVSTPIIMKILKGNSIYLPYGVLPVFS